MTFDISSPSAIFHAPFYIRHNQRRLEHLASLGLSLNNKSVLEPGAGIGDHSLFYLDRGCTVTALEPRPENTDTMRNNLEKSLSPNSNKITIVQAGVEAMEGMNERFDIVHSYGLLYHLPDPTTAIRLMAQRCAGLLLLETCVSHGNDISINPLPEPVENPTQAYDGAGCRPTRNWVLDQLRQHFKYVYVPKIQPSHDEFPTDWSKPNTSITGLSRAIFIASRRKLNNDTLKQK
jgi:hypothetical protein